VTVAILPTHEEMFKEIISLAIGMKVNPTVEVLSSM
jgi:hypothetical protein